MDSQATQIAAALDSPAFFTAWRFTRLCIKQAFY